MQVVTHIGVGMVVTGEVIRKAAMVGSGCMSWLIKGRAALLVPGELQVTAGRSFTHMLKFEKRQEHVLVTNGIYRCAVCGACSKSLETKATSDVCRYIRHPGYLGWLIWATGTQLILVNPLCAAGFICTVRFQQNCKCCADAPHEIAAGSIRCLSC